MAALNEGETGLQRDCQRERERKREGGRRERKRREGGEREATVAISYTCTHFEGCCDNLACDW